MQVMLYVDLSKMKEVSLSDQVSGTFCSSPLKHWPIDQAAFLGKGRTEMLGQGDRERVVHLILGKGGCMQTRVP